MEKIIYKLDSRGKFKYIKTTKNLNYGRVRKN